MTETVPWSESHTTYPKGARWWGRLFPYVIGEGDERQTVFGDWWTDERLHRLSLWQHDAAKALRALLSDDDSHRRQARIRVLAARAARETRAEHGGAWSFATWMEKASAAVRPTAEDEALIAVEAQRHIAARAAIRALLIRHVDDHPDGRMAQKHAGHPTVWSVDQLADAIIHNGTWLLRLARAGFLPHPGDLVPPVERAAPEARDFSEPQTARA